MRAIRLRELLGLALLLLAARASAHPLRLSYADYDVRGDSVSVRLRFAAADLAGEPDLARATLEQISLRAAGEPCALSPGRSVAAEEQDGVEIRGMFRCARPVSQLEVQLDFLAALPAGHTELSRISFGDGEAPLERVSQAGAASFTAQAQRPSAAATALRFLRLGVEHIFTGADHLAFILGLLLLGGTLRALIGIVSAFTLAHSLTLALAALGLWAPPARIIEPLIALSIVLVAAENLSALRGAASRDRGDQALRHRWALAFAFGLIHGFGFASALREMDLPRAGLATSLVSFNLGVELGQLAILLCCVPALRALGRSPRLYRVCAVALSWLIGLAGLAWLFQRIAAR